MHSLLDEIRGTQSAIRTPDGEDSQTNCETKQRILETTHRVRTQNEKDEHSTHGQHLLRKHAQHLHGTICQYD